MGRVIRLVEGGVIREKERNYNQDKWEKEENKKVENEDKENRS